MKYLVSVLALFAMPAYAASLTPEMVEKEIRLHSPRSAKTMYFKCDDMTGYDHIAQGTKEWLDIGVKLIPYTDGCERTLLMDSFARALGNAPNNMLMLVNSQPELGARYVCIPDLSEQKTDKKIAYLDDLDAKLSRVQDEQLKDKAQACLKVSAALRAMLQQKQGK